MIDHLPSARRVVIDTARFPAERRLSAFTEAYAEQVLPTRIDPFEGSPFWASLDCLTYGDVSIAAVAGSPMRCLTELGDTLDHEPGLMLDLLLGGHYSLRQGGREILLNPGDGALYHMQMPSLAVSPVSSVSRSVVLPEPLLRSAFGDMERLAGMHVPGDSVEMRLLATYLGSIDLAGPFHGPTLHAMVGRHVTELVLAAIARTLRREDPTEGRGVRAGRLAEVKRLIEENLGQPTLNAVRVARQLGVTERYVQKLIEESGTTFSAYVTEKRLQRARDILAKDENPDMAVRDIAWSLGFSDASHFTRLFRKRFGETPTSVRGSERADRAGEAG